MKNLPAVCCVLFVKKEAISRASIRYALFLMFSHYLMDEMLIQVTIKRRHDKLRLINILVIRLSLLTTIALLS